MSIYANFKKRYLYTCRGRRSEMSDRSTHSNGVCNIGLLLYYDACACYCCGYIELVIFTPTFEYGKYARKMRVSRKIFSQSQIIRTVVTWLHCYKPDNKMPKNSPMVQRIVDNLHLKRWRPFLQLVNLWRLSYGFNSFDILPTLPI